MQYKYQSLLGLLVLCSTLAANYAYAAVFKISTVSLQGQTGQIAFDFIDGGLPNNAFTLSNINFGVGSSVNGSSFTGGVSGNIASGVDFTDSDFFNELLVDLQFGNQLSFNINNATNLSPLLGFFPDGFAVFLLDSNGQSLVNTSDPTGANALFRWDFGKNPATNIYSTDVSITSQAVPIPASIYLLLSGLIPILRSPKMKSG